MLQGNAFTVLGRLPHLTGMPMLHKTAANKVLHTVQKMLDSDTLDGDRPCMSSNTTGANDVHRRCSHARKSQRDAMAST